MVYAEGHGSSYAPFGLGGSAEAARSKAHDAARCAAMAQLASCPCPRCGQHAPSALAARRETEERNAKRRLVRARGVGASLVGLALAFASFVLGLGLDAGSDVSSLLTTFSFLLGKVSFVALLAFFFGVSRVALPPLLSRPPATVRFAPPHPGAFAKTWTMAGWRMAG
jgi:hypothetical protein